MLRRLSPHLSFPDEIGSAGRLVGWRVLGLLGAVISVLALATSASADVAQFIGTSGTQTKKKVDRRVGTYRGTVKTGGTVSFRITQKLRVVDFTAARVPQRCYTEPLVDPAAQEHPKGTVTFKAPTMVLRSGKFSYVNFRGFRPGLQPGPFREISVEGRPRSSATVKGGKVFLHTANGNTDTPGTEVCTTGEPEFTAKKKN